MTAPLQLMYFLTFYPSGAYCFQVAEMTAPCRYGIGEVDFLVRLHNPDADMDTLLIEAAEQFIANMNAT